MIPYQFISFNPKSPAKPYWDQALILDLFDADPFVEELSQKGSIIIIPGAYQADFIDEINQYLSTLEWVVLIITSDEERKFPIEKIKHPKIKIYLNYPQQGRHDDYGKLPIGYTLETRKNVKILPKGVDFFFSGQITHERRRLCWDKLKSMGENETNGIAYSTEGFSQGITQDKYMDFLSRTKVAPCPSGAVSADSFRVYEALEAGAIPIADNESLTDSDYWNYLMPDHPFPTITDYEDLPGYIEDQLEDFEFKANRIQAWWIRKKYEIRQGIISSVGELSSAVYYDDTTIIVPVSYIPSHPDTRILEETLDSIRYHFKDEKIILTFDGLRKEHSKFKDDYDEFTRRMLFLINTRYRNIYPLLFDAHTHQVGMARKAMEYVSSPLVLYVEQDTPLVTDEPIEWDKIKDAIFTGESNMVRLHFEATIPDAHKHLMIGSPENGLLKTIQWSQRPHLASAAFYRRILNSCFSDRAKCFIEDVLHGKLMDDYQREGMQGWNQWRVHIYYPNDKNIKRSLHTDGRAGGPKYDDSQKF